MAGLAPLLPDGRAPLAAPLITDHDPSRNHSMHRTGCARRSQDHADRGSTRIPAQTDGLGRDMLSRILYGLRVSLVAFAGLCLSMALGVTLRLISGL
ncbi:MAG: hypothetical protein R2855_17975 [Thermomicrobiales bacterium]